MPQQLFYRHAPLPGGIREHMACKVKTKSKSEGFTVISLYRHTLHLYQKNSA